MRGSRYDGLNSVLLEPAGSPGSAKHDDVSQSVVKVLKRHEADIELRRDVLSFLIVRSGHANQPFAFADSVNHRPGKASRTNDENVLLIERSLVFVLDPETMSARSS